MLTIIYCFVFNDAVRVCKVAAPTSRFSSPFDSLFSAIQTLPQRSEQFIYLLKLEVTEYVLSLPFLSTEWRVHGRVRRRRLNLALAAVFLGVLPQELFEMILVENEQVLHFLLYCVIVCSQTANARVSSISAALLFRFWTVKCLRPLIKLLLSWNERR